MTKKDSIEDNANAEHEGYRDGLRDVHYRIRWAARNRAIVEKCEAIGDDFGGEFLKKLYCDAKKELEKLKEGAPA